MTIDRKSIRIAVVDDDQDLLNVFSAMLTHAGFYADFFSSSHEAFQAITLHPKRYDLLITDILMPDGDGVSFARKIRAVLPDMPVLFMTGGVTQEKRTEALALGRVQFLEKPFPLVEVLRQSLSEFIVGGRSGTV